AAGLRGSQARTRREPVPCRLQHRGAESSFGPLLLQDSTAVAVKLSSNHGLCRGGLWPPAQPAPRLADGERAWPPRFAAGLELRDLVFVAQGEPDVIEPFEEPPPSVIVDPDLDLEAGP